MSAPTRRRTGPLLAGAASAAVAVLAAFVAVLCLPGCGGASDGMAGSSSEAVEARERLRRGMELSRQGLHEGAAAELGRYLETVPDNGEARCLLGRSLLAIARRDGRSTKEAITQLRAAVASAPGKEYIRLQLAEALGERREDTYSPDEALAIYQDVIARDPDHYEARLLMARWLLETDRPDARALAREQVDRVLDLAPHGSDEAARAASLRDTMVTR